MKYIYTSISMRKVILCITILFYLNGCSESQNKNPNNEILLSKNGSWGYAGPYATIGNNQLYYSYVDTNGKDWISVYNPESETIDRSLVWEGDNDLHSANPLIIRPDGRLQIFIDKGSYVDNRIYWKVSQEPYSIDSFGELKASSLRTDVIQGRQFYPLLHKSTKDMYLINNALRGDNIRKAGMWKSSDGGDTFDEYHNLWALGIGLEGNRTYTRAYLKNDFIHFVTVRVGWGENINGYNIGRIEGIYYIKYNLLNESFYHADDSYSFSLNDTPIYDTEFFDVIWHWSLDGNRQKRAIWSDIVADENGKPYVAYVVQEPTSERESVLHDAYWAKPNEQGVWNSSKVSTLARGWDNTPERKNYGVAVDPQEPTTLLISKIVNKDKDLSRVQKFKTLDGGKTWKSIKVYSEKNRNTTVVIPRLADDSDKIIEVMWLEGLMEGWSEYDTKIKTYIN